MRSANTPTTAQSLGALLKSARDIMRKDKGLNGDLDRLPMLTWIMFLKFLDDLELQREDVAKLAGKKFKPAIESPYRWRDWAAKSDGITSDEVLAFINNEEATLPNGKKGAGFSPISASCATWSTRLPASISPPATNCTRWARSTNPCSARCAMLPLIPASLRFSVASLGGAQFRVIT